MNLLNFHFTEQYVYLLTLTPATTHHTFLMLTALSVTQVRVIGALVATSNTSGPGGSRLEVPNTC